MAVRAEVTPNRRGVRSRELVLDAAERVMAEHGFEAATLARVVTEARSAAKGPDRQGDNTATL